MVIESICMLKTYEIQNKAFMRILSLYEKRHFHIGWLGNCMLMKQNIVLEYAWFGFKGVVVVIISGWLLQESVILLMWQFES